VRVKLTIKNLLTPVFPIIIRIPYDVRKRDSRKGREVLVFLLPYLVLKVHEKGETISLKLLPFSLLFRFGFRDGASLESIFHNALIVPV
jgi:hypothetical protein